MQQGHLAPHSSASSLWKATTDNTEQSLSPPPTAGWTGPSGQNRKRKYQEMVWIASEEAVPQPSEEAVPQRTTPERGQQCYKSKTSSGGPVLKVCTKHYWLVAGSLGPVWEGRASKVPVKIFTPETGCVKQATWKSKLNMIYFRTVLKVTIQSAFKMQISHYFFSFLLFFFKALMCS